MASKPSKSSSKKVTPVQVAFLVERYLADHGFHASLAAFRSEAAHFFAKTRAKDVPRGLLGLAEILDDYIALKERRLAVEAAMQGMRDVISAYHSPACAALPHPSSPPLVPPLFVAPTSSASPPLGAGYVSPVMQYTQTSSVVVQKSSEANNVLTPATSSLPTKKRKATKSAGIGKVPSAPKKICTTLSTSSYSNDKTVASQLPISNPEQEKDTTAQPSSLQNSLMMKLPVQGSTVAKSLFRPLRPQASSCTQQTLPSKDEQGSSQTESPSAVIAKAHNQQEIASSQCSIVSSQTLIVSPLKGAAYYAVERSYCVSSPLKSSTQKSSKREHVKGKLDFGTSDVGPSSNEQISDKASTSSGGEKQDDFDIDFSNFELFDGDFSFSELLLDLDLDAEGVPHNPSMNAEVQRLESVRNDHVIEDPVLPDTLKTMEADPTEDVNPQGLTSVTSVRAITKRIKIVSPVKNKTAPQCSG